MAAHTKFPIDRETLEEMVGNALYEARDDIGVVEATLIARAVANAPRVAFGVWDDRVHDCRCPVGLAHPGEDTYTLELRDEYEGFTGSFDKAAKQFVLSRFRAAVALGVLEVR
jgi:hypothetical protein